MCSTLPGSEGLEHSVWDGGKSQSNGTQTSVMLASVPVIALLPVTVPECLHVQCHSQATCWYTRVHAPMMHTLFVSDRFIICVWVKNALMCSAGVARVCAG